MEKFQRSSPFPLHHSPGHLPGWRFQGMALPVGAMCPHPRLENQSDQPKTVGPDLLFIVCIVTIMCSAFFFFKGIAMCMEYIIFNRAEYGIWTLALSHESLSCFFASYKVQCQQIPNLPLQPQSHSSPLRKCCQHPFSYSCPKLGIHPDSSLPLCPSQLILQRGL